MPTNFFKNTYRLSFKLESKLSLIAELLKSCPLANASTSSSLPLLILHFAIQAIDSLTFTNADIPSCAPIHGTDLPVVLNKNHPLPPPSIPITVIDLLAVKVARSANVLISAVAERSAAYKPLTGLCTASLALQIVSIVVKSPALKVDAESFNTPIRRHEPTAKF